MTRLPRVSSTSIPESEGWGYFLCTYKELRPIRSGELLLVHAAGRERSDPGQAARRHRAIQGRVRSRRVRPRRSARHDFPGPDAACRHAHPARQSAAGSPAGISRRGLRPLARRDPPTRCGPSSPRTWRSIRDPHIRVLLNRITADHEARAARMAGGAADSSRLPRRAARAQAARWPRSARPLARAYGANEDLVLAGVLLHDIGKLQELHYEPGGATLHARRQSRRPYRPRADPGARGDQRDLGLSRRSARADRAPDRCRITARANMARPWSRKTVEAFILAAVDELDTRIHQVRRAIVKTRAREEFTRLAQAARPRASTRAPAGLRVRPTAILSRAHASRRVPVVCALRLRRPTGQ